MAKKNKNFDEDFDSIIGSQDKNGNLVEPSQEHIAKMKEYVEERRKNQLPEHRLKAISLGLRYRMEDEEKKSDTKKKNIPLATVSEVIEMLGRNKLSKEYKILDLFCGGGGVSMGIYLAGASKVTGVDIKPEPEYPCLTSEDFTFIQADATKFDMDFLRSFDFIWASPPCQSYTFASARWRNLGKTYPDLVEPTRNMLLESGVPFCMENVTTAPLRKDLILCGEMFGIKVIRHRIFEINGFKARQPEHIKHRGSVKAGHYVTVAGHGGDGKASLKAWQDAMQIHWMKNKKTLAESIPPVFSRYILEEFFRSYGEDI
jgi:DNA (cytosine-5)-methyltransferase 1